jgi:uncharacterized protein YcnI
MTRIPLSPVRTLLLALGTAATGVLLLGSAAAADVTITPTQAAQGSAESVTFLVHNDRPGAHTTKVEVQLPQDAPVAEVYPMTVPDWAPQIIYRDAGRPLQGIHGSNLTTATSAVIWTRALDAPAPVKVERLRLEMGPLPKVDQLVFTVLQTYSDGTVQRWSGPSPTSTGRSPGSGTVLALTADVATGGDVASGTVAGHHHAQNGGDSVDVADSATADASTADSSADNNSMNLLGAAIGGALVVGVVVAVRAAKGENQDVQPAEQETAPTP